MRRAASLRVLFFVAAALASTSIAHADNHRFANAAIAFDYPDALTLKAQQANVGSYLIALTGPRSTAIYVNVLTTDRPVPSVRWEILQRLMASFGGAGLAPTALHPVAYPFRHGSVRGGRVQLDNLDDDYVFDIFSWRKGEDIVSVVMQYKTGDRDVIGLFAPVIAGSIR